MLDATRPRVTLRSPAKAASWLLPGLLLLSACTGLIENSSGNPSGAGPGVSGPGLGAGAGSSVGGDPYAVPASAPAPTFVATPRLARLSRQQWSNAVRDLLKLTDISEIDAGVSGDALVGFDDEADALFVGEMLRKELATAAEKLADQVIGDPAAIARLMPAGAPADAAGRARAFITSFGLRAFRRPLTEAEVTQHLGLFNQGPTLYPGVDPFNAGVSLVIQALLQSPHFLYRTELETAKPGSAKVALSDYEVAAKLALALTNTIPDDELLAAAAAGELHGADKVAAAAKRLIDGPRGTAGISNFQMQVFRLGTYDGIMRDPGTFPDFTPDTPAAMREEVLQFLNWIFAQGRGVKDFYTAPVGFVSAPLAPLYGVAGSFTKDTLTKVDLDPSLRSGLLTQAGFLSSYMKDDDPDIIHRGVFIAQRILCVELPAPDPNATALVALQPNMTNRERVEATTGKGTCGQACHMALFNPLGYAFENYDAIGKYRTMDHGKPVNAADSYTLDGQMKSFANGVELSHLIADAKQTHDCYINNMMTYLNGRLLTDEEKPTVDYYARLSRAGKVSLHDLAVTLVTSDTFLNRLP